MIKSIKQYLSDVKAAPTLVKIHMIGMILLPIMIFATAICFIVSCTSIYLSGGDSPFTREVVAEYFTRIAPVTFICLALVIALGIISLYVDKKDTKRLPLSKRTLLRITEKRLRGYTSSNEYTSTKYAEFNWQRIVILAAVGVSVLASVVALIFILNPARYTSDDINTDIAYSVLISLSAAILSFAACYVASYLLDRSYERQIAAAMDELTRVKSGELLELEINDEIHRLSLNEGHATLLVRSIILVVSITFVVLGIFNGGMADVLGKAVRICTECIGLG